MTSNRLPVKLSLAAACGLLYATGLIVTRAQGQTETLKPSATRPPLFLDKLTGTWQVDPMHTNINFAIRHSGVNLVRGRFNDFSGTIVANGQKMSQSSVNFAIQAASIDTGVAPRDAHLKTPEFFDVATYPQITFQSSRVTKKGGNYVAHGTFTMHGVSKEIDLPFQISGPVKDGFGIPRVGVQSRLQLNRQDYGVKWNQVLDNGVLAVGNDVDIEINLEAIPPKPEGSGGEKPAGK